MSRDSETIRQLCVSLEAMTNERDQALIRAERAESIANDVPEEVGRLLKEVRDVTAQRNRAWDDLDTFADVKVERDKACAALEQERALRVAADDAIGRLTAAHESVTTERDLLRGQLEHARLERDEAVDGYDRVRSIHLVMCDEAELRDGLATLIDATFGLKTEPTPNALLTALKEGIRRLSTEANAVAAENLRLKEAGLAPPEGPGGRVEAYFDECAGAPAVALYPKDRSNGRWTTLDRVLDAVSEEFPKELIAAADRLRAVPVRGLQPDSPEALAAVLNAIATTHPEKLLAEFVEAYPERIIAAAEKLRPAALPPIVGKWEDDCVVEPGGRRVRVAGDGVFVDVPGSGSWGTFAVNHVAVLHRAGLLPPVREPLDREDAAWLALRHWTASHNLRTVRQDEDGSVVATDVVFGIEVSTREVSADNAVYLCSHLGIKVDP